MPNPFAFLLISLTLVVGRAPSAVGSTPLAVSTNPEPGTPNSGAPFPFLKFPMEEEILGYVNKHRLEMGLPALMMNETESRMAARHSENMASGKVGFGHGGFNSRAKAIRKAIVSTTSVAENVAEGQMTSREVVDGWLQSPGHKKNIEGNYTLTGIGYARDKKGDIYFTQLFSR